MTHIQFAPCLRYGNHQEWVPTEYLQYLDDFEQYSTADMLGMLQGDISGAAAAWRAVMVMETIMDRLLHRVGVTIKNEEQFFSDTSFAVQDVPQFTVMEHHSETSRTADTLFARLLQSATTEHAENLVGEAMFGVQDAAKVRRRVFYLLHMLIADEAQKRYAPFHESLEFSQYRLFFAPEYSLAPNTVMQIRHKETVAHAPVMFLPPGVTIDEIKEKTLKVPRYDQVAGYLRWRWSVTKYRTTYQANTLPVHALLYDVGVLEQYFAQMLQRVYQTAAAHDKAITLYSWWMNAVLTSFLLDATQAIEREYDTSDMPLAWLKRLLVGYMPSADDFVDMLCSAERFLYDIS